MPNKPVFLLNKSDVRMFHVTGIQWDFDSDEEQEQYSFLPDEAVININPDEVENEDELSDYLGDLLSDNLGFCHNGFQYEEIV